MVTAAVITPWGRTVRCGIRSYSEALTQALAEKGCDSYIVRLPRLGHKNMEIIRNVAESVPVNKVDIVLVEHEYGLYAGLEEHLYHSLKLQKKPIITTIHGWGVIPNTDRLICAYSDRVIAHNRYAYRVLRKEGCRKTTIIPHGCYNNAIIDKDEARDKYNIPRESKIVGYVGFLSEYKGIEALIEATSRIQGAYLLIGGGYYLAGPEPVHITNLKTFAERRMPGRYNFTGFVPDEDLPYVYGAMDCIGYPAQFASESGAVLMAMSYGKAIVASNLQAFKEKAELGALTTFRTNKDFEAKLRLLLNDEEARKRLEDGAKRYCEANSWSNVASQHIALFERLLRKP